MIHDDRELRVVLQWAIITMGKLKSAEILLHEDGSFEMDQKSGGLGKRGLCYF